MMSRQCWLLLGVLLVQGCYHAQPDHADLLLNHVAGQVRDVEPPGALTTVTDLPPSSSGPKGKEDSPATTPPDLKPMDTTPPDIVRRQLTVPPGIPGSNLPPIQWPETKEEQERALLQLFPDLPPLPRQPCPVPGPTGKPMTLAELQSLAVSHHPSIRNAVAAVEAARGGMFQAGAYPNPTIAWEADTVHTGGAGYQGGYVDQPIKGANKLKLQTAISAMDVHSAEIALEKAQYDLATQVRTHYFAILVALENIKVSLAMVHFTEAIYRAQVQVLKGGFGAPYEPMQLRPLVLQARLNLIQGINQYHASWRQLAAAIAKPNLPPTQLSGRVDWPVPVFHYDEVLARVLEHHTDVRSALVSIRKARYSLELAEVTPFPDFDVRVLIQKDYTTPPNYTTFSAALSMPIPIWDQNRGGIIQAKNQLLQALGGPPQAQLQLTGTLAEAFNRYETASQQVQLVRAQIEDQLRVYRALYLSRFPNDPAKVVGFADLVTAQQTLVLYVGSYITALGLQWQAVVDVANLLQTNDLFQVCPTQEVIPVPDLEHLMHDVTHATQDQTPLTAAFQSLFSRREGPLLPPPETSVLLPPLTPGPNEPATQGTAPR